MNFINALGLATAILCGGWIQLAGAVGLLSWAGFSGCTSYFACPDKGLKGVISCACTTMTGVAYALISTWLGNLFTFPYAGLIFTMLAAYLMCIQSKIKLLSFIPGTFFGSFSTFAAGGSLLVAPSILCGILLGLACDKAGTWLFGLIGKKEEGTNREEAGA